ncbi:hypothetical protein AB6E21_21870, partial [Photobacterium swingsii]|uniref:hypothetical protein n=1 Tax=Photobacterium swingsii TaxID=680026 RepID=UPI00354D1087
RVRVPSAPPLILSPSLTTWAFLHFYFGESWNGYLKAAVYHAEDALIFGVGSPVRFATLYLSPSLAAWAFSFE